MKKPVKIVLFILLGIIIVGTFIFLWSKSSKPVTLYETIEPEIRDIEKVTIITGTIEPRDEVVLKPQISGIIAAIYKEPGDIVRAGDVIAKVQVVPDIAQLNAAESQLKMAEINLEKAKNDYDRNVKLYQSGVISKETYDNSNALFQTATEDVATAKENIQIIKEGISSKTVQYSNTQIRATISGMILDIPVKVGNSVIQSNNFNDGTTIATIADMNDLIFIGRVDETEVGKIGVGNPVKLTIGAMQDTRLDAELEYISPKGALTNGATLFEIKAAVKLRQENPTGFIRSGYSANGEIVIEKKENITALPESSITFENDSAYIYILNTNADNKNSYTKTPVSLGISNGVYVEILTPLAPDVQIRGKIKSVRTKTEKEDQQ